MPNNVVLVAAVESWSSFLYGLGLGFATSALVLSIVSLHYVRKTLKR